jgi:hypothetical protein
MFKPEVRLSDSHFQNSFPRARFHRLRMPIETGGRSRTALREAQTASSRRFNRASLATFWRAKITVVDFNGKRGSNCPAGGLQTPARPGRSADGRPTPPRCTATSARVALPTLFAAPISRGGEGRLWRLALKRRSARREARLSGRRIEGLRGHTPL